MTQRRWNKFNNNIIYILLNSTDFLKQDLDEYVAKLPVFTKVHRLPNREGLVAARLLGAKHATGQVRRPRQFAEIQRNQLKTLFFFFLYF